jgi:hypothetical protein
MRLYRTEQNYPSEDAGLMVTFVDTLEKPYLVISGDAAHRAQLIVPAEDSDAAIRLVESTGMHGTPLYAFSADELRQMSAQLDRLGIHAVRKGWAAFNHQVDAARTIRQRPDYDTVIWVDTHEDGNLSTGSFTHDELSPDDHEP